MKFKARLRWCRMCDRRLFERDFYWRNKNKRIRATCCPDCLSTYKRLKKIEALEKEASEVVDELEEIGKPFPIGLYHPRLDPRRKLYKLVSDIQWLKSLPYGRAYRSRPRDSYDPFV